ncbi:MAG: NUDIX domain-containing protein [Anaerolineae bacterium]|nr:NUDIX domain-containing protein [Anaerolineae bacterium]
MESNNLPKVGVGVLVERDGKLLLHRRKGDHGPGTWSPAGGHLEYGETPEECAIREVWEEIGVTVREVAFMGITNDVFSETQRHYVTIWMHATVTEGEAYVHAEDEVEDVDWFAWDALPEPLFLPLYHLLNGGLYANVDRTWMQLRP